MKIMNTLRNLGMATMIASFAVSTQAGLLDNLAENVMKQPEQEEKKSTFGSLGSLGDIASMESISNMAQTGTLDTNMLIKDLVDQQCRSQLNDRQEWKIISFVMSDAQKTEWEDKVCGCATEETVNSTSQSDLIKIANPSTRTETVANITTKAVTSCVARLRN